MRTGGNRNSNSSSQFGTSWGTKYRQPGPIPELRGTKTGLQLVYYGILLIVATAALTAMAAIATRILGGGVAAPGVALAGRLLVPASALVGVSMMLIGQCFCLTVPAEAKAKVFVAIAVGLQAINLASGVVVGILTASYRDFPGATPHALLPPMQLATPIFGLIAFFCFLAFIRRVARYIGRDDQAQFAMKVVATFVTLFFLWVLLFGGILAMEISRETQGTNPGGAALAFSCIGLFVLIVAIVALCMYTVLLRNMIKAVKERLPSGSY